MVRNETAKEWIIIKNPYLTKFEKNQLDKIKYHMPSMVECELFESENNELNDNSENKKKKYTSLSCIVREILEKYILCREKISKETMNKN